MAMVRNCPIDMWNADMVSRFEDMEPLVFTIQDIDRLLKRLSEECKQWQESDGKIWWDSPESWLRKQLNLEGGWEKFAKAQNKEEVEDES